MLLKWAHVDLQIAFKSDLIPYETKYVQLLINLIDSILDSFLSMRFLKIASYKCHKVFAKLLFEGSSLLDLFICLTAGFMDVLTSGGMSALWSNMCILSRSIFTLHREKFCQEHSHVVIATEGSDQGQCN